MEEKLKQYIFFSKDGFTYDPTGYEIHNLQIIGDATGKDTLEAFKNLKINQPYLKQSSFTEVMALETIGDIIYDLELT